MVVVLTVVRTLLWFSPDTCRATPTALCSGGISHFSASKVSDEVAKGTHTRHQLSLYDSLMETRIRLQQSVNIANKFAQVSACVGSGLGRCNQRWYAAVLACKAGALGLRLCSAVSDLAENSSLIRLFGCDSG